MDDKRSLFTFASILLLVSQFTSTNCFDNECSRTRWNDCVKKNLVFRKVDIGKISYVAPPLEHIEHICQTWDNATMQTCIKDIYNQCLDRNEKLYYEAEELLRMAKLLCDNKEFRAFWMNNECMMSKELIQTDSKEILNLPHIKNKSLYDADPTGYICDKVNDIELNATIRVLKKCGNESAIWKKRLMREVLQPIRESFDCPWFVGAATGGGSASGLQLVYIIPIVFAVSGLVIAFIIGIAKWRSRSEYDNFDSDKDGFVPEDELEMPLQTDEQAASTSTTSAV